MTPPQAESATLPLDEALYRRPSIFQQAFVGFEVF